MRGSGTSGAPLPWVVARTITTIYITYDSTLALLMPLPRENIHHDRVVDVTPVVDTATSTAACRRHYELQF